ncbi:MAG: DegQ family serine endoprotease [Pseudomonadota bacterium]
MKHRFGVKTLIGIIIASFLVGLIVASGLKFTPSLKALSNLSTENDKNSDNKSSVLSTQLPSFVELAKELQPAVVNISTTKVVHRGGQGFQPFQSPFDERSPFRDFFDKFFKDMVPKDFKQTSLGSGFIIDEDGYILTNYHVIQGADEVKVKLSDNKEFKAEIKGKDPKTDIALIKIKSGKNLPVVKLGDSDKLEVGEWVVAIGNPFGLDHTVTAGIVSAKGRIIGAGPYDNFIQTDASINPGNSGGPLINLKGEVIGINTAIIASGQGIGFAIPINMAKTLIPQLKEKGKVVRGWLGVVIQKITPDLAKSFGLKETEGALVTDVLEGSPAEKAGIKRGDIIIEVDGEKIDEVNKLSRFIATLNVGRQAKIKIVRNGKESTLKVLIGEFPEKEIVASKEQVREKLGMVVQNLTPGIAKQFGYAGEKGVLVTEVVAGSPADEAGIRQGDLIKEINRNPVNDLGSYMAILDKVKEDNILLLIRRADSILYVVLKIPVKK